MEYANNEKRKTRKDKKRNKKKFPYKKGGLRRVVKKK